jgi:hypothetical protein
MKSLMKCILLSISVFFLLPQKISRACGFYVYPGEYRFWLLQPDLTNERDLTPFYFAASYLYKGNQYAGREVYAQQNVAEWYEAMQHKASKNGINELLYSVSPKQFFEEGKNLSKTNSFLRCLLQPKNKSFYRYFALSKKVEDITSNPDPWDEQVLPLASINIVIDSLHQLRRQTANAFIKLRCAYQILRLYNYNRPGDSIERYYDAWIAPVKTKSWVKSAALYQVAINYHGPKRDYLLSKVFDRGGYNRTDCLVRFSANSTTSTLKLAKNSHEKNVIMAMQTFNYSGRSLSAIKQIYATEPTYIELPFLLLREINKVEDWLLTNKLTSFGMPAVYNEGVDDHYQYFENAAINYRNDKAYAKDLSQFVHQMISDGKHPQKAALCLYAAYTDLLNGDYIRSRQYLNQASLQPALPRNLKTQITIHRFLLALEKGFDRNAEKQFMNIVRTPVNELGLEDADLMKNQLILYTARKMIARDDRARGLLLLSKTNRALGELPISNYKTVYQEIEEKATEADYYTMLRIFDKNRKSSFERFVCEKKIHRPTDNYWYNENSHFQWSRFKLIDCLASFYLRQHRLADALAKLKLLPDSFWEESSYKEYIGGNPFYLNVHKAHSVTINDKRDLNRIQVINEMIHLEALAKQDKDKAAECYYQLANAWYNMTWYGKNWLMVKQWWSINEPDAYYRPLMKTPFNDDYYGCRQAKLYYEKARKLTKDKKLAALCIFIGQHCENNYNYYMQLVNKVKDVEYNDKPDYAMAKRMGVDVNYYKQMVEECETYLSFIKQYNKKF